MSATVPSQRAAATPADSGVAASSPIAAGARFFHAPATAVAEGAAPDEAALATWWRRFHDPELDRLIDATVGQGYEVCAATLRLRQQCETGSSDTAGRSDVPDEVALYEYYSVRLRQIAMTARHYFLASTLQERIVCTDSAIADVARAIRAAQSHSGGDAVKAQAGDDHPVVLADLHAHRIVLRAQWDAAAIALAHQSAQPLAGVIERLCGRLLPGACAETPALGGPDRVLTRRPDVLAQRARAAAAGGNPHTARLASLACEQREDLALKEVELALATLAAAQAELVPVRASAASAEAQYQRLRRRAEPRSVSTGARVVHAFRDREIETRGRGYLALVDAFHAAGCGWPVLADPALEEPALDEPALADPAPCGRRSSDRGIQA